MRGALILGLRILAREWRSGELAVLFLALLVAVSALTGVGFLVDRIDHAMQLQASEVLAADLRMESSEAINEEFSGEAQRRGLSSARVTTTLSVVLKGDATQLTNVRAVSSGYPLRGKVRVADVPFGSPVFAEGIPASGEIWPDSRLLAALDARVGTVLTVGARDFRVTRVLISRPDQGSGFVDLSPSLLMNDADLESTELIQPGSRASYAALFAGPSAEVKKFAIWLSAKKGPSDRLGDIAQSSPEVSRASSRASRFLTLASLASVLLCAVAIAMTARRYVRRHLDLAALLKTLGATRAAVLVISIGQLVLIAVAATILGGIIGYFLQQWLLLALRGLIAVDLPDTGWQPLLLGLCAALLLLIGFALPPMLQLSRVPAMRVLRKDIGPPRLGTILAFGPAVLAVALLIFWVSGDRVLGISFFVALLAATLVLTAAGLLLVWLAAQLRSGAGFAWRFGVANLTRRRADSVVQIVSLGLGLSVLLLLAIIRGDLIDDWRSRLPQTAPNYFFINIPSAQKDAFESFLTTRGGQVSRILPMIRGRIIAINDKPVAEIKTLNPRAEGFMQREQNLTWSAQLGTSNTITEGKWFSADDAGKPLVSVATEYQESMALKLGDRIKFDIAGEPIEVTVASFRRVEWDSLQPNFFLMFPPGLLEGALGTYMASAQFRPTDPASIAQLVRQFPSVSVFDMDDLLTQIRSIIDKAVLAVQSVFLGTLLAGVVVLLAAVQATRDERRYESAMLRTLGASRRTVLVGVLTEFALIGVFAGVIAAAVASTGGYLLATRVLNMPYHPNPGLWLTGAGLGALLVCIAGYLTTRSVLSHPPLVTLGSG
ncbi:MAG: FtsX-like permease family protein [Pseudomonadota bacterium]